MRRKILVFLLALASAIACMFCITACNGGGTNNGGTGGGEQSGGETDITSVYVGKYEFLSMTASLNGSEQKVEVGKDGVTADYIQLELNEDGTYIAISKSTPAQYTSEGTWTVKDGKLVMSSKDNSMGSFNNVSLTDGILTISSTQTANIGSDVMEIQQQMKLKKVVEENPTTSKN